MTAEAIIRKLELIPHPEGGYYKETYRSAESIPVQGLPGRFKGQRSFSTSIYYLLQQGDFSAFHRIKSDECWHFYAGGPLLVHMIRLSGEYSVTKLGSDLSKDEVFQFVVPAGSWFGSEPAPGSRFSLVGCTVAPGFDFQDFEIAGKEDLLNQFPRYREIISRMCRS